MLSLLLICVNAVATKEAEHLQLAEDEVLLQASGALAAGESELDLELEPPEAPQQPPRPQAEAAPTSVPAGAAGGGAAAAAADPAMRTEEAPAGSKPAEPTSKPKAAKQASTAGAAGASGSKPGKKASPERLVFSAEVVPVIKFVQKPDAISGEDRHYLVILEALELPVPSVLVYLYPIIACAGLFATWLLCCFRSDRSGFSCRLAAEAVACFPCLWAELATKYKSATACRNWTYVYALMALLCIWSACATFFENKQIIRIVFYVLFALFWAVFTYERVMARRVFRRTVDPFTENHTCSDCTVTMCCAPMSAMQEAHIMAKVEPPQPGTKPDAW